MIDLDALTTDLRAAGFKVGAADEILTGIYTIVIGNYPVEFNEINVDTKRPIGWAALDIIRKHIDQPS